MSLPDILKVKPMPTVDTMTIHTSILEPVICNQNVARFQLERRGILDINSAIQVGAVFQKSGGDDPSIKHYPPIRTGGHAFIKTATLRIGGTAIATTQEYGQYNTMMRQFKSVEERVRKEGILSGTVDGMESSNLEDGGLQPMNIGWGREATATGEPTVSGEMPKQNFIVATSNPNAELETCIFALKLSDIFPMCRNLQLPLYLIQEPVSIEIEWQAPDRGLTYIRSNPGGGASSDSGWRVAPTQVKFLADYLTYSDDRMAEMGAQVMSEQGLQMTYNDLILTTSQTTGLAADVTTGNPPVRTDVNREIGLSSRVVKNIMWSDRTLQPAGGEDNLLGQYRSDAYCRPDEFNLRINDRLMFNRPVVSESQKNNYLAQCHGVELQVSSCEYSLDQNVNHTIGGSHELTLQSFSGKQDIEKIAITQASMGGHSHYCGVDLVQNPLTGSGTQIGQKPVALQRTIHRGHSDNATKTRETLIWATVERQLVLKSGVVSVTE
tara:strand:+ start:241 stop:1725 length:1485 start_codon:yes stop_codon:yes gene_type:complete